MKEVILDTETTGISVKEGHRIVEIGCIELDNLIPTKNRFHCYLNPERKVSEKALEVHGYTDEFLAKQKKFSDIGEHFLEFIKKFPIKKSELVLAISSNKKNLKIISSVVHPLVRKKMREFIIKNKKYKMIILDIPLLIENKLNKKKDIIIFVQSNAIEVNKRLEKRENYNKFILQKLKNFQFSQYLKRKKSKYVIKNDFKRNSTRKQVKDIIKEILL